MERFESIRATPAQGYGCGSASAFNAAFVGFGGGGVCSIGALAISCGDS